MLITNHFFLDVICPHNCLSLFCAVICIRTLTNVSLSLSLSLALPRSLFHSNHIQGFLPSCSRLYQKNTCPRIHLKPALHQCSKYCPALQQPCSSVCTQHGSFSCLLITLFKHDNHNKLTKLPRSNDS